MKATKILSALIIGMMIVSAMPLFATAQTTNDTLVIALQSDMKSMNPWDPDTNDVWKSNQIGWNFEGLMAYNPDFELYPVLAAEKTDGTVDATITNEGMNINVKLRQNVTFTDGKPMTSKDVVFSYQTLGWGLFQTQVLDALYWDDGTTFTKYDGTADGTRIGVQANGTYAVSFYLSQPYAMFWYLTMAVPVCPWHIWQNHSQAMGAFTGYNTSLETTWDYGYGKLVSQKDATIGTGPMYLDSWVKEQGSVIKPYANYWDKEGTTNWAGNEYPNYPKYVKEMRFKIYTQLDVAILALQNGEVHHLPWSLTPGYYNQLKTDPNIGIETNKDQGLFYMSFNLRKEGIADKNFRRAIAYCVDKQYIVDRLMGGYGIKGSVPMSVTNTFYVNDTVPAWIQGGNLDAAKALLNANGYTDKDGDGWRDMPDGSPIKFNILTPPKDYDPIRADSGIMIEKNLKSIGLNIAAVPTSFDTIVSAAYVSLDFDMYVLGWSVGSFPESYMKDFFHSSANVAVNPSGSNAAGYQNATVDAMIDEMAITMDTAERAQLIKDICGATMMDVVYDTLYYRTNIEAYRKDIWTGWIPAFGTIYNGFSIFNLAPPTDGGDDGGDGGSGGSVTMGAKINMPSMAGAGQTISGTVVATELLAGATVAQPCSGATVNIVTGYGQTIIGTTDSNGVAEFTLTVPYQRINNFTVDANISKSGAWVNVDKLVEVKFTNHIAQLTLSTNDGVIAPGATTVVTATVKNEMGMPIPNAMVYVDNNLMFGWSSSNATATNAMGIANFTYHAPPATMLPNQHRFEQFKANVSVPNVIVPEIQSASLIIGISNSVFDWHDLDITNVTAYVIDNDVSVDFPNKTNITLVLKDSTGAVVPSFPVSMELSAGAAVISADPMMKNTDTAGKVTFTLTVNAAFTGAQTVLATFNTSKPYGTMDSVAIYIRNNPTFTTTRYNLNVTEVTRDVIYNHYNNTDNTTTITVRLLNNVWAPVSGIGLYMGLSDDSLVRYNHDAVATNATGYAKFNITCIANGSADLAVVFGNEDGVGIYEGYHLKVNKTAAPVVFTTSVVNEHVYGPAIGGEKAFTVDYAPVKDATIYKNSTAGAWTKLAWGTGYTMVNATGAGTLAAELLAGQDIFAYYNYTVTNETLVSNADGTETYKLLAHSPIQGLTLYKNDSVGAWSVMTETVDYNVDLPTGNVTFPIALSVDDDVFAYYNATVANETVILNAVGGENGIVGPAMNLDYTPIANAQIFKNSVSLAPAEYTLNTTTGDLTLATPLAAGNNIDANYNWTRNVAKHRLDVTSVSSYIIDSNLFANAHPETSDIVVKFTAIDGTPVNGKNITAIAWGDIGLVNEWALTNATGYAVFTATSITTDEAYATVYFNVKDSAGVSESVTLYNAPYVPGYAADIDFTGVASHDSTMDITATVYGADGNPAAGVPCQFFIPPTAEGIPGVFQGGDEWIWNEYGDEFDMGWWASYLGSWFKNAATVTDANGTLVATIDTASFIADTEIPLQFGVGGTGVAESFSYSANNWWMEDYGEDNWVDPLTEEDGNYYFRPAGFTMIDQVILKRAPLATLTKVSIDQTFLSKADNTTTVSLTFQNLAGPLNAIDVNFGLGTAKPTILDENATSAAGVYTYTYTFETDSPDFDSGIGFTTVVQDSGYAKFPFNFYLPYLAIGTTAQALVVAVEPAAAGVDLGEDVVLDITVMDEYGRLVNGATVAFGTNTDTTDANGVAQLTIPTTSQTVAGIYTIALDVTKGAMSSDESVGVILLGEEPTTEMVDIIIGPVKDKKDAPIQGALVTVSLGTRQAANYSGTTNTTGYATISVPASWLGQTVSVTITKAGYETVTYTTTLNADGTLAAAPPAFNEVEEGGISMALIAVIIVVIVVILVVVLVVLPKMKGGKGDEPAAPKEEEPAMGESPVYEEIPSEEAPAEPVKPEE